MDTYTDHIDGTGVVTGPDENGKLGLHSSKEKDDEGLAGAEVLDGADEAGEHHGEAVAS